MKITWRNREPRVALMIGPLVALATGLTIALGIILDEGGGSLIRGWKPGLGYLGFYGIALIPVMAVVWLVTTAMSRLLGAGIVLGVVAFGLGALLIHGILASGPRAQLKRITGRSGIPKLEFEQFHKFHSFSDGTGYAWVARCSPEQAIQLADALNMERIAAKVRMDGKVPIMVEHWAVGDYRQIFDKDIEGVEFYVNNRGMLGGYSPNEQRFRIYWWPRFAR